MRIKALTIVVVTTEEDKPPAFALVGNLSPQKAYTVLHEFMLQEAKRQGKEEIGSQTPKMRQESSQQALSDSEGVSEGVSGG
jgi:hypothetical protein